MADNRTIFQKANEFFLGGGPGTGSMPKKTVSYNINTPEILYKTDNPEDYARKKMELQQQRLLQYQWKKSSIDSHIQSMSNLTNIQLMYRDADLMAERPEIGAALDIVMEEACCLNSKGRMLNIYSKSNRVKAVLEDLFINRLDITIMLPMICREMCKYGNSYQLLNIDREDGILGWRSMNVYEMQRNELGSLNPYMPSQGTTVNSNDVSPDETTFLWVGHNETIPYKSWQMAHFRNLSDTVFLPYGVSWLHKARRAWRMLSMMEDAMLIHRLDKSIERRIFKINVGTIDEQDVQAYINQVADEFKRTPVIDPATGQVDLRKNFLDVSADYFIPVRNGADPSSIETLNSAQYQTAMDDIEYMHNMILAALRMPKTFLNFQEAQGKGQNLSILDIRFCRMIQRIQQSMLMELNKIAMLHLYFLGFTDDLTNFVLSLNNPSAQIEALELEDLTKRVQTAAAALADPGIGMPLMSLHKVLRDIMKMTDEEITDQLNEIRLEKAMAAELQLTNQVIKKTGVFDTVDRIYGDPGVMYKAPEEGEGGPDAGAGGGGEGFDGGSMSMDSLGGTNGEAGATGMAGAPGADAGMGAGAPAGGAAPAPAPAAGAPAPMAESVQRMANATKSARKSIMEQYISRLTPNVEEEKGTSYSLTNIYNKNLRINDNFEKIFNQIDESFNKEENSEKDTLND